MLFYYFFKCWHVFLMQFLGGGGGEGKGEILANLYGHLLGSGHILTDMTKTNKQALYGIFLPTISPSLFLLWSCDLLYSRRPWATATLSHYICFYTCTLYSGLSPGLRGNRQAGMPAVSAESAPGGWQLHYAC